MKTFKIPGFLHEISVKVATQKTILKNNKDIRMKAGEALEGLYDTKSYTIWISSNQPVERQKHRLWHELSHHLDDSTSGMEEEMRADMYASWMLRLLTTQEYIDFMARI